jgi:DNA-binding transcriptional LysR family regulator
MSAKFFHQAVKILYLQAWSLSKAGLSGALNSAKLSGNAVADRVNVEHLPEPAMQTKWIDDLLAVAETKNFSRAAEIRCITQSALSRRIKSLEEWVGVDLVDRGTYPVQLTKAGQIFCSEGREALSAFMDLRSSLRRGERMPGRSIQVIAGHTLSMTFVPKWFAGFQRRYGYFNARVLAANVQEAVIAGRGWLRPDDRLQPPARADRA